MNRYKYLKKLVEVYEVTDEVTGGSLSVTVTDGNSKIYFDLDARGTMLSDSVQKCIDLLKELITIDCYSSVVREGEEPGKVIVTKQVEAKFTKRKAQNSSFLPTDKGETA